MKKSEFEHIKVLESKKVDPAKSDLPANLKRAITNWDKAFAQYDKSTDDELRTQWQDKLVDRSNAIAKDIEEELEILEKKKKASKDPKDPKDTKDPKDPKDPKDTKDPKPKQTAAENDEDKEQIAIIDKLYADGVRTITEEELEKKGFKCWTYLGFLKGEIGPYKFTSTLGNLKWTITKKKEPATA